MFLTRAFARHRRRFCDEPSRRRFCWLVKRGAKGPGLGGWLRARCVWRRASCAAARAELGRLAWWNLAGESLPSGDVKTHLGAGAPQIPRKY